MAEVSAAPAAVVEEIDRATVTELRAALTATMRGHLIATFEQEQERCVGAIAVAARRADHAEVRRLAHLLKGGSASLGANWLRLCAERLEHAGIEQDSSIDEDQLRELRDTAAAAGKALRHLLA